MTDKEIQNFNEFKARLEQVNGSAAMQKEGEEEILLVITPVELSADEAAYFIERCPYRLKFCVGIKPSTALGVKELLESTPVGLEMFNDPENPADFTLRFTDEEELQPDKLLFLLSSITAKLIIDGFPKTLNVVIGDHVVAEGLSLDTLRKEADQFRLAKEAGRNQEKGGLTDENVIAIRTINTVDDALKL